jgi:hypothetical protein
MLRALAAIGLVVASPSVAACEEKASEEQGTTSGETSGETGGESGTTTTTTESGG